MNDIVYYRRPSDLELWHHGVKGMKWGVRRTPAQLGHKVKKLEKRNTNLSKKLNPQDTIKAKEYSSKSAGYRAKATKYSKKASDYSRHAERIGNTENDSYKSRQLASDRRNQNRYSKKATKNSKLANRYQLKADKINTNQNAIKAKIAKNKELQKMYRSTIRDLNAGTIRQGRLFMQYSYDY